MPCGCGLVDLPALTLRMPIWIPHSLSYRDKLYKIAISSESEGGEQPLRTEAETTYILHASRTSTALSTRIVAVVHWALARTLIRSRELGGNASAADGTKSVGNGDTNCRGETSLLVAAAVVRTVHDASQLSSGA